MAKGRSQMRKAEETSEHQEGKNECIKEIKQ